MTLDSLESFWDDLLSRSRELILAAYNSLEKGEQAAVLAHLRRMLDEPDWHAEQRLSALAALEALEPGKYGKK